LDESKREIDQLLKEWALAVERSDAAALGDLVTEDAEFWSHGAAPLAGREALVKAMQEFFSRYRFRQEFRRQETISREGIAFLRGLEVNRLEPRQGGDPSTVEQRAFSVVVRGSDGRWRFARGMTNAPPKKA
jgi:uncharacterized protein (TIGR02246 family)